MDLLGMNRFFDGSDGGRPPKKGPGRFFEVLYDHLGALLGCNFLTFLGFLPLALGVSLGVVLENFWLALLGGAAGGAAAGPFWAAMAAMAFQCFRGGADGWFGRWRGAMARLWRPAAAQGGALGLLAAGLMMAGGFFAGLLGSGDRPAPFVWIVIALDLYLLALAAALLCPGLPLGGTGLAARARQGASLLLCAPGRALCAAAALLAWSALLAGLFPVSVPLAAALGFWPPALLYAQLLLPALEPGDGPAEPAPAPERAGRGLTAGQRTEIWWRRRWPLVLGVTVCLGLLAGTLGTLAGRGEPDLQVAIVRAEALPDGVRNALERSLAARVGDLNGDGTAIVVVNDYTVVFDGSAADPDLQTAGMARLVTDVAVGDSALFAVADPGAFIANYGDKMDLDAAVLWADCPALSALDAGSWSTVDDIYTDLDGQELLAGLTVLPARSAGAEALALLAGK